MTVLGKQVEMSQLANDASIFIKHSTFQVLIRITFPLKNLL